MKSIKKFFQKFLSNDHSSGESFLSKSSTSSSNQSDYIPALLTFRTLSPEELRSKVASSEIDPNAIDEHGFSSLHFAAKTGNTAIIKCLIEEYKLDPNIKSTVAGLAPLHIAVENKRIDVVKYLVNKEGVDINAKDSYGNSIMYFAVKSKNVALVQYLIEEKHLSVNGFPGDTKMPLNIAKDLQDQDMIQYLLNKESNLTGDSDDEYLD